MKTIRRAAASLGHDFRRTATRNMIRAGVPQSIAMRVTGHEADAIFYRYDITDNRDKAAALEAARKFAQQRPGEKTASPASNNRRSPSVQRHS